MRHLDKDSERDISECPHCAVKHMVMARVEYSEYLQNVEDIADLMWAIGDLGCAERHLMSLNPSLSDCVRQLRLSLMEGNIDIGTFDSVCVIICKECGLFDDRDSTDDDKISEEQQ